MDDYVKTDLTGVLISP